MTHNFSKQAELDFIHNFRHDTEGDRWAKHEIETLRQQVSLLRSCLKRWAFTHSKDECDHMEVAEALAATDDLSGYILCEREPIAWKCEQEHFDSMGGISTEYMSHKIECVDRSHWVPLYAATAPKEQ